MVLSLSCSQLPVNSLFSGVWRLEALAGWALVRKDANKRNP